MTDQLDEALAIERVREYVAAKYPAYVTDSLVAEAFEAGWVIFPAADPSDLDSLRVGQTIFVISVNGKIMEASSSLPPGAAEAKFMRLHGPLTS